jgi:ribokinase
MGSVASFGSINVDRVAYLDREELDRLVGRYDWFPTPGETRRVQRVPAAVDAHVDETFFGGKGANQAVAAARAGADSALYGQVGTDANDLGLLASLADYGVDVGAVGTADATTGTAYVFVDPSGENHIAIIGGANAAVDRGYVHEQVEALRTADCLLVQNELPVDTLEALFDALDGTDGPLVVFVPAPTDGAADLLDHDCIDAVVPNETEATALGDRLTGLEATVIRTRGAEPVAVDPGGPFEGEPFTVAPPPADPVDTTGAGDVFAGYLAAELADGRPLRPALDCACGAAAVSTEREGVQRATPAREAVPACRE